MWLHHVLGCCFQLLSCANWYGWKLNFAVSKGACVFIVYKSKLQLKKHQLKLNSNTSNIMATQDNIISLSRGSISYVDSPTPRLIFNSPNRAENRDLILFGGAVKNLIHFLPKAFEVAKSITEEELKMDRDNIFDEILSCYTAQTLQMRNHLSVNTYNGHISIWIKRFFFGTDTQQWHACKGGYQITCQDLETYIMDFLNKHIGTLQAKRQQSAV